MKIKFLASTASDLRWFKNYYITGFPEGKEKADFQFEKTKELLKTNPFLGHSFEGMEGVRIYSIPRIPFSFLYRVTGDVIEVMRVLDSHSEDSNWIR